MKNKSFRSHSSLVIGYGMWKQLVGNHVLKIFCKYLIWPLTPDSKLRKVIILKRPHISLYVISRDFGCENNFEKQNGGQNSFLSLWHPNASHICIHNSSLIIFFISLFHHFISNKDKSKKNMHTPRCYYLSFWFPPAPRQDTMGQPVVCLHRILCVWYKFTVSTT